MRAKFGAGPGGCHHEEEVGGASRLGRLRPGRAHARAFDGQLAAIDFVGSNLRTSMTVEPMSARTRKRGRTVTLPTLRELNRLGFSDNEVARRLGRSQGARLCLPTSPRHRVEPGSQSAGSVVSAPTLSFAEQAQVDRFGLHDEDVLHDLAKHADDQPTCIYVTRGTPCGHMATHAVVCAACNGIAASICADHAAVVTASARQSKHGACQASGMLRDLVRLVPL